MIGSRFHGISRSRRTFYRTFTITFFNKMAAANGGRLFAGICAAYVRSAGCVPQSCGLLQVRGYAARKGTREKARKSKVKVEVKKVGFIPHNQRESKKDKGPFISKRINDSQKPESPDNVWAAKYYRWRMYSFAEAVQCHRESHHPTVYDEPDALLVAYIELNMQGVKKNRYVEKFTRVVDIPHPFPQNQERSILALCKDAEAQKLATEAGATLAGGSEIIKEIMAGALSLSDYKVVVAHPNILPELVALRGLMKKKFPNLRDGNLDPDVAGAVKKFVNGVEYNAIKDERELDFGSIETPIGRLDMDPKHLEENFAALLKDVNTKKPKREGSFITKTLLLSAPSVERLKVDFELYVPSATQEKDDDAEEDDEDDQPQAAASTN